MERHIGETFISKMGEKYTIIEYIDTKHVTVQFEDGTIVSNRTYSHCKNSHVGNPNNLSKYALPRIGKTRKMLNGLNATIIEEFKNSSNKIRKVLVRFEDGYERKCDYTCFCKGCVKHPNINAQVMTNRLGMVVYQKHLKQNATVVEYEKGKNFVIKLDDGRLLNIRSWYNFANGILQLKKQMNEQKYVGQEGTSLCGLKFEIIEYENQKNVKIRFEDGTQKTVELRNFRSKRIHHPIFDINSSRTHAFYYKGLKTYFAFKTDSHVYFNTDELGIMEIHELMRYENEAVL